MAYPNNIPDDEVSLVDAIAKPDLSELEGIETALPATLENIMTYANRMKEIESEVAEYSRYTNTLKGELKSIEENKLPQMLEILGMADFSFKDGSKVILTPTFQGTIVVEDEVQRKKQLDWMIKNEGQDHIKNTFTITFGKGQDAEAKVLRDMLVEYEFDFEVKETVHAGSLGAFIKEKLKNGEEVPLDELKWRYFQKAALKEPAKAKVSKEKKVK